eukprot:10670150-Alexandrium_andersonii.AAC.1
MSASLVGSEMCIRDRVVPMAIATWQPRSQLNVLGQGGAVQWLWRLKRTVSYTHLTLPTICSV